MTPFMVQVPVVDNAIFQTYPEMGFGNNGRLLYVPSSPIRDQNPTYVNTGWLDWALYSTQPQHLLIKEVIANCADYVKWNGDHFTEIKPFDFSVSFAIIILQKHSQHCIHFVHKFYIDMP